MDLQRWGQKIGSLEIEVVEGRDLAPMDDDGTSDPYVLCIVGSKKKKTKIIYNTTNPKWNLGEPELFTFSLKKKVKTIIFECYDYDKYSTDDREGMVKINVDDIIDGKEHDGWWPLVPLKDGDKVSGELHLKLKFMNKKNSNSKNKNPLFEAVLKSDVEGLSNLLKTHKVDLNGKDADGQSPLHLAAVEGNPKILLLLLRDPRVKGDDTDAQGNTALHRYAARSPSVVNHQEIIQAFLDKAVNIDVQNLSGDTPLHKACFNPSAVLIVDFLLSKGADAAKANKIGEMPIHYAIRMGRTEVCDALYAGSPSSTDFTTAIKLAQDMKYPNIVTLLKSGGELLNWLSTLGLRNLALVFLKNEVTMDLVPDISETNLTQMKITDEKVRRKIMDSAQDLKKTSNVVSNNKITSNSKLQSSTGSGVINLGTINKLEKTKSKADLETQLRQMKHTNITQRGTACWLIAEEELEIGDKLGKGASGSVYKGKYLDAEVAIKVLPTGLDQSSMNEFQREFEVISALESPHAVKFYGVSIKNRLCIVMEYCSRGSIYGLLKDPNFDFGWNKLFDFALGAVKGINALHSWDPPIMHRDLKSLNLLVDEDWHVKVCDFGLSRFDTSSNLKTLSVLRGTYAYVAPEIYSNKKFTPKSDVYSMGMLLWEMSYRLIFKTYLHPFEEYPNLKMDFQILIAASKKNVRPTIPPTCPPELASVIRRCLDAEADKRPSTLELQHALEQLQSDYGKNKAIWDQAIVGPPAST